MAYADVLRVPAATVADILHKLMVFAGWSVIYDGQDIGGESELRPIIQDVTTITGLVPPVRCEPDWWPTPKGGAP